jgi:hypothetical protein
MLGNYTRPSNHSDRSYNIIDYFPELSADRNERNRSLGRLSEHDKIPWSPAEHHTPSFQVDSTDAVWLWMKSRRLGGQYMNLSPSFDLSRVVCQEAGGGDGGAGVSLSWRLQGERHLSQMSSSGGFKLPFMWGFMMATAKRVNRVARNLFYSKFDSWPSQSLLLALCLFVMSMLCSTAPSLDSLCLWKIARSQRFWPAKSLLFPA